MLVGSSNSSGHRLQFDLRRLAGDALCLATDARPTMPGPNKSDAMKPPPWRAVLGSFFADVGVFGFSARPAQTQRG